MCSLYKLKTCEICKQKFEINDMLESVDKSCYCKYCFKSRMCTASGDKKPNNVDEIRNKIFPYPEIYTVQSKRNAQSIINNPSMMSLSKRPLQCPKADCNRFISVFTLESHFKYEHKEVPIVYTQLDARSALEFYPRDVKNGVTQCIVLLSVIDQDFSNIIPKVSSYCSHTNLQSYNTKPIMVLLSSRLSNSQLEEEPKSSSGDYQETASTKTYTENDSRLLQADDKIVIWLASNIQTNLSYTVAASTLSNKIRQKYFGPMAILGERGEDLCRGGNCLILTHFHINGMSDNGIKPLALDVVIHSPD